MRMARSCCGRAYESTALRLYILSRPGQPTDRYPHCPPLTQIKATQVANMKRHTGLCDARETIYPRVWHTPPFPSDAQVSKGDHCGNGSKLETSLHSLYTEKIQGGVTRLRLADGEVHPCNRGSLGGPWGMTASDLAHA